MGRCRSSRLPGPPEAWAADPAAEPRSGVRYASIAGASLIVPGSLRRCPQDPEGCWRCADRPAGSQSNWRLQPYGREREAESFLLYRLAFPQKLLKMIALAAQRRVPLSASESPVHAFP